jgi:hypothetical protein
MEEQNEDNEMTTSLADKIKQPESQLAIWLRLQAYNCLIREEG